MPKLGFGYKKQKTSKINNRNIKKSKSANKSTLASDVKSNQDEKISSLFDSPNIKDKVAPDGVNPNPLGYFTINDMGKEIYIRNFTIEKLPKRTTFAVTFTSLLNYSDANCSVFINPLLEGTATKQLDKRILKIDSERIAAEKEQDRNRYRKMDIKLNQTEEWSVNIESGENSLFEVGFIFSIYAESLEILELKSSDFISTAREKGIELVATYSVHPEAYLSNGPYNKIFSNSYGYIKAPAINMKNHLFDKYSLSSLFNHINSSFSHPDGVPLGRLLSTGEPVLWTPYHKAHNGFGVVFSGKTGTGKSGTIKILESRLLPFDTRVASIDTEQVGNRGEYSASAEMSGGVNFVIGPKSNEIVNLFEIDVQEYYDAKTATEYKDLKVAEKKTDLSQILLSIVHRNKLSPEFTMDTYLERLINDALDGVFEDAGIIEGDIESLYTTGKVFIDGKITTGKVKKELPTMTKFFMKILQNQKYDKNAFHEKAYTVLIDIFKDYVKELYYDNQTLEVLSKEDYTEKASKNTLENIIFEKIIGSKPYYDGQSTVFFDENTPHVNIDISSLPKNEKPIGQEIALNFLNENFIKKNSENPAKAKQMIIIIDEAHKMFKSTYGCIFIGEIYRTARKRHVSPWTATQALTDFDIHPETQAIVKNSSSIFLFKQDYSDREFLCKNTVLTESQVDRVLSLGGDPNDEEDYSHKGEVCLIDNEKVSFIKVDYLEATECFYVETDMVKLKKILEKRGA